MVKLLKTLFVLVIIIIFVLAFSNSYNALSIENLAYVLAIGIDTSSDNKLKVSFQFSSSSLASESGSSEKASTFINTVTASSLSNAINLVNGYLGKQINLSHCKVIIFSEKFALQGISDEIYTLINDTQIRPSANIVISKCDAKYYIEQTKPELENLISKYYEVFTSSSKYTGYMPDTTIGKFFDSLICTNCEPYAILGGVNKGKTNNKKIVGLQKDYEIKANQSSISGENGSENIGVAVFKEDKLVGELNALETICLLNVTNNLARFLVSVPDPENNNHYIDIYLTPLSNANIKVNTNSGSPYIKVKCRFSGRIYSMSKNSKYLSPESLDAISNSCSSYLESIFTDYLYRTSKDLQSDISGFSKYALKNFFTTKESTNYDWRNSYKDAFFDVKIDTSIKSGMLITQT